MFRWNSSEPINSSVDMDTVSLCQSFRPSVRGLGEKVNLCGCCRILIVQSDVKGFCRTWQELEIQTFDTVLLYSSFHQIWQKPIKAWTYIQHPDLSLHKHTLISGCLKLYEVLKGPCTTLTPSPETLVHLYLSYFTLMRWWWFRQWWWDDNEKFEAAMPFVIIRGNINGQIRDGSSCSAFPSKKGNLSNLSSSLLPSPTHHHHHDEDQYDGCCRWQVCLWRCRRVAPKVLESWQAGGCEYSYLQLTNPYVLCPRKHSPAWQKPPTHLPRPLKVKRNQKFSEIISQYSCCLKT